MLDSLGITEERSLARRSSPCDVTRAIGKLRRTYMAHMLESAFGVDAIIPINRVKTHVVKGCVESGLCRSSWWAPGRAGQAGSTAPGRRTSACWWRSPR
ncbi:MAG: hypothetical protein ACLRWP_17410 [Bilophila wadsworthia]